MDIATIQRLQELNNDFYTEQAASFAATRTRGWAGWERVVGWIGRMRGETPHVLDVGCGNMRFEAYCRENGLRDATFLGIDSCTPLAARALVSGVDFRELDVIGGLLDGQPLASQSFDAAVCFGFFHHVPGEQLRHELLAALIGSVVSGGVVAVSFWQFMNDERIAKRASETTAAACSELGLSLEAGDYLLGWERKPGVYRYCHHYSDAEINALVESLASHANVVERYHDDGSTGNLNAYLVIER